MKGVSVRLTILRPPQRIFIYGVPGSGKTTIGRVLAARLGYRFMEGDRVRMHAQGSSPQPCQDPFLFLGTTEAWRQFGELSHHTAVEGLMAVRDGLAPYVAAEIEHQLEPFVLEAAFLRPRDVQRVGPVLLVVTEDEQIHESHFFEHRVRDQPALEAFRAARMLQDYLTREAGQAGVGLLSNRGAVHEVTAHAVQLIRWKG